MPDVSKIEILGAQDERIFVEFSMKELANLGVDRAALIARPAGAECRPPGRHDPNRRRDAVAARLGRLPVGAGSAERQLSPSAAACCVSLISRRSAAALPIRLSRCSASTASRQSASRIAMRDGGDILALGKNIKQAMATATADLPIGIEPKLVADQAVTVESAIDEFMTSLWQAVAIILAVSFISLGMRPGLVIALSIPLTLAIVFSVMELSGIDMQRISLGALIIALALLVDDAMTTTDATLNRLAAGDDKVRGRDLRVPHLRRSPCSQARSSPSPASFPSASPRARPANTPSRCSPWSASRLIVSWFVAVVFAPLLGVAILKPPKCREKAEAPARS